MAPILGIMASQISGHLFAPSGAYDSIATTTLSTATASITFSSIPATYTHLQVRLMNLQTAADNIKLTFNSDTASNYSWHQITGDGATAGAASGTSQAFIFVGNTNSAAASYTGAAIIDVLEYANINIYKTVRSLLGSDSNGSGLVALRSGNWRNTAAVTSITLTASSGNLNTYTSAALYGIKGA